MFTRLDSVETTVGAELGELRTRLIVLEESPGGGGSGPDLSDDDPLGPAEEASPGVGGDASRSDHVHPLPDPADLNFGGIVQGPGDSLGINDPAMQAYLVGKIKAGNGVTIVVNEDGDLEITITNLAITNTSVVANEAAMLALSAQEGDVAIREDTSTTWILGSGAASSLASWHQLATPTDVVLSVAGRTGVVVLAKGDVGLSQVDNTADVDKPVSTPQAEAIASQSRAKSGTVAGAFAPTTGGVSVLSSTIAVPQQGAGDHLRVIGAFSIANFSGGSKSYTPKVVLGGVVVWSGTATAIADGTTRTCTIDVNIDFSNVAAEYVWGTWAAPNATAVTDGTGTVSTSGGTTLDIQVGTSNATGSQTVTPKAAKAILIKAG